VAVKEREQTRPDIFVYDKALCMKQIKGGAKGKRRIDGLEKETRKKTI
jgi:hypothetical protein